MGGLMRMFPLAYRMVTAGVGEEREMLQLRFAWALRCSVNVSVQDVHSSTPVRGVLSIEPVMDVGRAPLFEGCSYRAKTAYFLSELPSYVYNVIQAYPDHRVRTPSKSISYIILLTSIEQLTHRSRSAPPPSWGSKIRCVLGISTNLSQSSTH